MKYILPTMKSVLPTMKYVLPTMKSVLPNVYVYQVHQCSDQLSSSSLIFQARLSLSWRSDINGEEEDAATVYNATKLSRERTHAESLTGKKRW